ncbi:hypothetical protein Z3_144 [Bacillus phage Z3]|nr:hypothetical protein Z3_144 [Bacillus phage Z3]
MEVYELVRALTTKQVYVNGKVGTPIRAYVLRDVNTGEASVFTKMEAYEYVKLYGSPNCEARVREVVIDGVWRTIHYLKPTDGRKVKDILMSVE